MPFFLSEPVPGVMVQASNLYQANSVIVVGQTATLAVDPAWFADELAALRQWAAAGPCGGPTHIVLTHCDFDHAARWADVGPLPVVAHPAAAEANWDAVGRSIKHFDEMLLVPRAEPFSPPPASLLCAPGELDLGGERALLVPVGGHTATDQFIILPQRRLLIAGDYLLDLLCPIIRTSTGDYIRTLNEARRLCHEYGVTHLIRGHGRCVEGAAEIERRIDDDYEYACRLGDFLERAREHSLSPDGAVKALELFTYRGRPLTEPRLLMFHQANIKLLMAATASDR